MSKFKVGQRWITRSNKFVFIITEIRDDGAIVGDKYRRDQSEVVLSDAVRYPDGSFMTGTSSSDDLTTLLQDVKENGRRTRDGFEIKLGDTLYGLDGCKVVVLGLDSDEHNNFIIYRDSTNCLCCHYTSEFTHNPPKPEGFEITITSNKLDVDYHAIYFKESFICNEYQEKIKALKGHKIKVTVEVL